MFFANKKPCFEGADISAEVSFVITDDSFQSVLFFSVISIFFMLWLKADAAVSPFDDWQKVFLYLRMNMIFATVVYLYLGKFEGARDRIVSDLGTSTTNLHVQ